MKIGSLFSGGGGGDLGFTNAGHEIVFGCEIDPKARSVFRYHHPNIPIYHDVAEVTHAQLIADGIAIPDLIMGGSPCQDLSVAGKRAGLGGERSGLFYEQCRIADEVAAEWVCWENVPGAFSSNAGQDFASVLGGLTGNTPTIPKQGWRNAGVCVGPKRVAVWRVLDAQNFGVPQRRRRVFVVAGPRALARRVVGVLFEPESCDGDSSTICKQKNEIGFRAEGRFGTTSSGGLNTIAQCLNHKYPRNDLQSDPFVIQEKTTSHSNQVLLRLHTPVECERLMGWPDNYTAFGLSDDGIHTEIARTKRYRICGNGIVATVTEWIGNRLPKDQQ